MGDIKSKRSRWLTISATTPALCCFFTAVILGSLSKPTLYDITWSAAQWAPSALVNRLDINTAVWKYWEQQQHQSSRIEQRIPVVQVQQYINNTPALLQYLTDTYGSDWKRRPLLLKGLWDPEMLHATASQRRLSLEQILQENLTIPFFKDSRQHGALTPDGRAPLRDIVANITRGHPHKIATQLLVQAYPDLIREIAPLEIVSLLFGTSYFTPEAVQGSGPWRLLPAMTTVPLFIASRNVRSTEDAVTKNRGDDPAQRDRTKSQATGTARTPQSHTPFTALHCEPIGNIAVQLSGRKQWTLISPEFSRGLRPAIAPDGRAYFASWISTKDDHSVPYYTAETQAGDAIWVPTWTWHRVDYTSATHIGNVAVQEEEIAVGASLFHFRPKDFFVNNPLFAVLILPAMLLELIGYNTQ
jgi:Cupin-like domain